MRSKGSANELERRRQLAVKHVLEGYSTGEVAEFLEVDPRSVRRWVAAFRAHGDPGLAAKPAPGRPPKLTITQEKIVRRWLSESPTEHGFATEFWTAPRLAQMIEEAWEIEFHPRRLTAWLRRRGFTPQKPRRRARERDPDAVAAWLANDWPRIKKSPAGSKPRSPSSTKADC